MPSIGIADKVTLDAIKTLLGLNTDAAGTSTVFARLAQIAGYIDQVKGYVDTLESSLAAGVTIGRTGTLGSFSTTNASLQTALNLSGKGSLLVVLYAAPTSQTAGEVKITVDGTVFSDTTGLTGQANYLLSLYNSIATPTYPYIMRVASNEAVGANPIDFKSSLKIEISSDGIRTGKVLWAYNI